MRKLIAFFLVLFFDAGTKHYVAYNIPIMQPYWGYPFGGIGVFKSSFLTVSFVHTTNTGAAWSLLADQQGLLLALRVMITLGLLGYLLFGKASSSLKMPLTLICAGAVGNIIDVFFYGHVIDMVFCLFYHYSFPVFNVADSVIFCSVAYIVLFLSWKKGVGDSHVSSP